MDTFFADIGAYLESLFFYRLPFFPKNIRISLFVILFCVIGVIEIYLFVFYKKLEDLRFVLTDEMNKMFIEVLIIKQRLEEDITLKEQMVLEKELKILTSKFIKEFRKNNVEQIKEYKELVNQ